MQLIIRSLMDHIQEILPNPRSWRFLPIFSSRSVIVLGFMFRNMINLNIYIRCKVGSGSLFWRWISNYFSIVFWKDYFPWVAFACLSKISCLYCIPLTCRSFFMPIPHCLDRCSFGVSEIGKCKSSHFTFFFNIIWLFWILCIFIWL